MFELFVVDAFLYLGGVNLDSMSKAFTVWYFIVIRLYRVFDGLQFVWQVYIDDCVSIVVADSVEIFIFDIGLVSISEAIFISLCVV